MARLAGSAIEVPMRRGAVERDEGADDQWPQFENEEAHHDRWWLPSGRGRDADCFTELVQWIHKDYGLSEMDAYELLSKVAKDSFERDGGSELCRGGGVGREEIFAGAEETVRTRGCSIR